MKQPESVIPSIAKIVREIIDEDLTIQDSLERNYGNYSGIARIIKKFPDKFLGWIFINPLMPESLDELDRWKDSPGMIGVKIHPFWHQFPIEAVEAVGRRTEELGLPLLVHLGFDASGNYRWLIDKFPRLKIIIAHLGVPFYKKLSFISKA